MPCRASCVLGRPFSVVWGISLAGKQQQPSAGCRRPSSPLQQDFQCSKLSLILCVDPESMQSAPFAVFLMVLMHLSQTWGGSTWSSQLKCYVSCWHAWADRNEPWEDFPVSPRECCSWKDATLLCIPSLTGHALEASDLSSLSRQVENMFHFGCIHRSHGERAELWRTNIQYEEYTDLCEALERAELISPKNRLT